MVGETTANPLLQVKHVELSKVDVGSYYIQFIILS